MNKVNKGKPKMTSQKEIDILRTELSIKMRNGVTFIIGGCISWLLIMLIWIFNKNIFMNNIYTVIIGGMVST
ncbi:MAG: hypothetical protein LBQ61_02545, partial [Spirochaetales bacterium]|nr:hypothetical protein [Spirochaetales bacterium]